jgi:septal ring factor EnvC (AmiA/AmiB activator)
MRPFPEKPGGLLLPAHGAITVRYGERLDRGFADISKGVVIETRAGAQVVAPFDGRIAYAGPFRAYGLILIIEHGGRYHTLLAGMERIAASVGQWVLAGEPVAEMSKADQGKPELYIELRRSGQPINPLPWLATNNDKARG